MMHKQQTGQGQRIDVSMLESLTEWMSYPLTIYPYGPFPAGDGKTVHLWGRDHEGWLTMDATATLA